MARAIARAVLMASELSSAGSVMRMPRFAPIASARRIASTALGGPIEMTVTSPPSFSTSWRPASTPCSSPGSRTRSTPSRTRRLVHGSSLPGVLGSGICLTQTSTFMAGSIHYGEIPPYRTDVCIMIEAPNGTHRVLRDRVEIGPEPGAAHGLQLVPQPLPGLLPQLRVLFRSRPRQARRARSWCGLLGPRGGQGECARPPPPGTLQTKLEARDGGVWNRDRSLSADRGPLSDHPPLPRGVPRLPDTDRADHQGHHGGPRYRRSARALEASEDDGRLQHPHH